MIKKIHFANWNMTKLNSRKYCEREKKLTQGAR